MSVISIGTLRYDIISDTTSFVRGIKATSRQKKEADRIFREGLTPMQRHNFALIRMMDLYRKGMITKKQVLAQQVKIKATLRQEQAALRMAGMQVDKYKGSYAKASSGLAGYTASLNRNTKAIVRNRAVGGSAGGMGGGMGGGMMRGAANGNRWANFGGSFGSAMGFGGAGAGMGRIAGMGSAGFAGLAIGGLMLSKMIKEVRELETALVDMQVIMGDDAAGEALVNNLRQIARETPLTSKALIKGAQTLLGYGLSAEGLEDTMYRIGEIAGGNTQRMESLTRAFAQVQSAGKLMGQEMLQLVNAGFPVAEIAKAAGVSMEEFRDAMEAGEIKASHLTEAMVNLTSAGGMMEGRLARQADTINGKWITAMGSIDQAFADMGDGSSTTLKGWIQNFGEFTVGFINGMDDITDASAEFFRSVGAGWDDTTDRLDEHGKKLSGYGQTVRSISDFMLRNIYGYTQAEIDAQRATDRKWQKTSDAHKEEARRQQAEIDGRKKIKESIDNEVKTYEKAQAEKAQAIYDEMKPEEDLAAMRKRHQRERWAAIREGTRLRAGSGNAAATKYYQATLNRQKAEEAKMQRSLREERMKADYEKFKELEKKKYDLEKKRIKEAEKLRKKQIEEDKKAADRKSKAIGDRGKYTAMDTYTASTQIEAEYKQNDVVNKANERRERQLDHLNNQVKTAEAKAEARHNQRMKVLDNTYNNGKP